jgi:hypothetical protein
VIPRAARVPVFPEEWLDLVDDIQTASVTRRGERARPDQSFSTAPVLRQSYATLCEKVGRKRVPARGAFFKERSRARSVSPLVKLSG